MNLSQRHHTRRTMLVSAAITVAAVAAGSATDAVGRQVQGSQDEVDAALAEGGTLTYWTWTPSAEAQAAAFEEEYPNVDVEVVNVGTGSDHYTKLENAIRAGSGAPDVAQIEYHALPQFAFPGHLVDLGQYGFEEFADDYLPSAWESAHGGTDALYALPQGGGPMLLLYNNSLFEEHGVAVPTTWDEYVVAARALKEADPSIYITSDTGDAGFIMGMIWQAGGRPFSVDGDQVTINFDDEGTQRFTSMWNQLLQEDLLSSVPGWTEEWFKALGDGTIATLPAGSWMADIVQDNVAEGAGDWRVAPMPTYDGAEPVSSEHGGSHEAVLSQSANPALAAGFLRWLNHEEGNQIYMDEGGLPATITDIESPDFVNVEWEYFGGQQVNQVAVDAANVVGEGWEFLPYQTYANSIAGDTIGQAYVNGTDLNDGLLAWQEALVEYGRQQGFDVNGE